MFFTVIIVRVALHHFLAVQSPIRFVISFLLFPPLRFLKSLYRVSSSPPSPCHYSRLSLQHHKLKVCACAVLGSELRVSTRNEKTVLEKKNTFLRNYKRKEKRDIDSFYKAHCRYAHTHKYICRWISFPDSTRFAVSWQLNSCFFFVFLPSLFTLFCLVETLIIFLGILMSPLSSNTTEMICPGTRYIRHRGTHH